MDRSKIVYLHIQTWVGICAARHYYGRLHFGEYPHKVEMDLSTKLTAARANKLNSYRASDGWKWKPGHECSQFFTAAEVRKAALRRWRKLFPDATMLIAGDYCVCDPQEILDAEDRALMRKANAVWRRFEANDGWEGDQKVAQAAADRWEALMDWQLETRLT